MNTNLISDKLEQAEKLVTLQRVCFFGNSHKRNREWWVLGRAIGILNRTAEVRLELAVATEPPDPDFRISTIEKQSSVFVEILEVIEDGRKRHQELKMRSMEVKMKLKLKIRPIHVLEDPFSSFRREIKRKCGKQYPEGCWLIVFLSVPAIQMPEFYDKSWSDMVFQEVESWKDSTVVPDLGSSPFGSVFVLDAGGRFLVSIYPKLEVFNDAPPPCV